MRPARVLALCCATLAGPQLAGCASTQGSDDGRVTVAAAFYPIEDIVRHVGGDEVRVLTIVPPGEEAHEYEPTPKQMNALEDADVVFYLGDGFQPNVEKAIAGLPDSVQKVDLLEGLTLLPIGEQLPGTEGGSESESLDNGNDPHVWLDPANMEAMASRVADVLAATPGVTPPSVRSDEDQYVAALAALDAEMSAGLGACRSPYIVTAHHAFGYLAHAYGLTQVAIAGISPTEEPSAKSLEAVAAFAAEHDVTTIFFESNLPADLSRTVADEIGARTAVLENLESPSDDQRSGGADYIALMRTDLATLRTGLGCT